MSPLEEQMAEILAKALIHELNLDRHHFWHPWFQGAAWALVDYSVEKEREEQEKLRVNY